MGIYVNPGNLSFRRAVNSKIYVDKTGLLEFTNSVIDTEQCCICVSRPRRFGKSMAAGMLAAYYGKDCDSRELFQGKAVAEASDYEQHMNQYDVIHIDIAEIDRRGESADDMLECLNKEVIAELDEIYPDILSEGEYDLPHALADIQKKTGARFVIIIDEWDTLFREHKYDTEGQKKYIQLLRGLFKGEASKKFVKLAYITGILPIKKYGTESALNNFYEFTMVNPKNLTQYVGFTEEEVKALCYKYDMDFEEMERWYDGYAFRKIKHVYNPNSVVQAIITEDYDNYWSQTETYESLKNYISMNFDGLKDTVIRMLAGGHCRINTNSFGNDLTSFQSRDDVLTLLIHLGYLAYDKSTEEIYIPNDEVRTAFTNAVQGSDWKPVAQAIRASDDLLNATWRKDAEAVAKGIYEVHQANSSILAFNNENALSCVITLAYYNAVNNYKLVREMPAGKGYADIVFLPKNHSNKPAMIVELKYGRSAEEAMEQIKSREYTKAVENYKDILIVGVNYDENKKYTCVIEEWKKE